MPARSSPANSSSVNPRSGYANAHVARTIWSLIRSWLATLRKVGETELEAGADLFFRGNGPHRTGPPGGHVARPAVRSATTASGAVTRSHAPRPPLGTRAMRGPRRPRCSTRDPAWRAPSERSSGPAANPSASSAMRCAFFSTCRRRESLEASRRYAKALERSRSDSASSVPPSRDSTCGGAEVVGEQLVELADPVAGRFLDPCGHARVSRGRVRDAGGSRRRHRA